MVRPLLLPVAIGCLVAAVISYLNRKALHMPSGGTIGERVEQNSHMANAIVAHTTARAAATTRMRASI